MGCAHDPSLLHDDDLVAVPYGGEPVATTMQVMPLSLMDLTTSYLGLPASSALVAFVQDDDGGVLGEHPAISSRCRWPRTGPCCPPSACTDTRRHAA